MIAIKFQKQQGAALVVGLILLVLITLLVTSAFNLSTGNLKAVGNMQTRDEAISAANVAIERLISTDAVFFTPAASTVSVPPYTVSVAAPVCMSSVEIKDYTSADPNANVLMESGSGVGGGGGAGGGTATGFKVTYWDITATVSDATTGAQAEVHQGVKITLPASPNPCP